MIDYIDSDSDNEYDQILGQTFFNKYLCLKKLGKGFTKQYITRKNTL